MGRRSKKPRPSQPLYKTHVKDNESSADAREYGALSKEDAARLHASYFFRHRDGWECKWPLVFMVHDPADDTWYAIQVELEQEPVFVVGKPQPMVMDAAVHVLWGTMAMCDDIRLSGVPGDWPKGQQWISLQDVQTAAPERGLDQITCEKCKKRAIDRIALIKELDERKAKREADAKSA
jgi:hypothetical protein